MTNKLFFSFILIYFFLSGTSVCGINIPSIISNGLNFFIAGIGIVWLIKNKTNIDKYYKIIAFGIFVPVFISLISGFINIFFQDYRYTEVFFIMTIGRKINVILFLIIFTFLNSYINTLEKEKLKKLLTFYIMGIMILFIFFGIWQFFNKYFNIPMINLNTRSHIHSVSNIPAFIKIRITGLANEPSYAAPYLIDSIIICWILKNKKCCILSIVCLFLTYSGGGYINILIIFLVFSFYPNVISKKNRKNILIIMIFLGGSILLFRFEKILNFFSPVLNRFNSKNNLLDISYNIRTYMIVMPFIWILQEKNFLSALFGMGPGSYKYLSLTKKFIDNRSVHITSNNIFSDFVYETGYIGLFSLVFMFLGLLKMLNKNLKKRKDIYNKSNILLLIHILVSSLYRADFMSSRFWIILIIIKINILLSKANK